VIKYISYKNLDLVKYDQCIEDSFNVRIYAFSWYLDCVADSWDTLVLNDYEAVMPLPKRKKYGLYYIYQVAWIQQLGVFSKGVIDADLISNFINSIPNKFVLVDYFFNSGNDFTGKYVSKRTNFILPLNRSFEDILNGFNKNRKRASKSDFTDFRIDKKGSKKEFLELYAGIRKDIKSHAGSFEKIETLLSKGHKSVHIWNVYKNEKLLAGLVWLKDSFRITYLLPVALEEAKQENIPTFLINELIKEYQNTNYILDFEGSMVKGVARFYRSFGAEEEEYGWYKKKKSIF